MWFPWRGKATEESAEALKDAQNNLREVSQRTSEVRKVAKALKDIRERNHFAEQVEDIILRRRGSTR